MSLLRPVLNAWLRRIQKPHLARVEEPAEIRRAFARNARIFFHAPLGTTRQAVTLGGRPALEVAGRDGADGPRILYLHGGAYVFGSPATHAAMLAWLCRELDGRAVLPEYSKAPENRFPAALEDAEAAWQELIARGEDPARMIIGGDSAGGGLALALLGVLLAKGHPLPAGVFAFSPLTDLALTGDSLDRNADADVMLPVQRTHDMVEMYLGDHDPRDPRASPLYADFKGAPPVFLSVGETEILLDDTRRMQWQLAGQAVAVTVEEASDLPHVWPIFHNILPEARTTLRNLADWIRQRSGTPGES